MRNASLSVLFVLLVATPAFAGETVEAVPVQTGVTVASADQAPPTLAAALTKVAREYREMWIQDPAGKKVKRACDFQCTQSCSQYRTECYIAGHGAAYCEQGWQICMCENSCCWGPGGNPHCI